MALAWHDPCFIMFQLASTAGSVWQAINPSTPTQGPLTACTTQVLCPLQEQLASTQTAQKAQKDSQAETARLNAEVATLTAEVAKAVGLAERQKETIKEQKDKIKANCSLLLSASCRSNCGPQQSGFYHPRGNADQFTANRRLSAQCHKPNSQSFSLQLARSEHLSSCCSVEAAAAL